MNKLHFNEVIISKLTPEDRQKLVAEAVALGDKHVEVLTMQEKRQTNYVPVEDVSTEYEMEMRGFPPTKMKGRTLAEAEAEAIKLAVDRVTKK